MRTFNYRKARQLREQKGVSIAEMAPHVNMSESLLGQAEKGARIPNANHLGAIAEYLGVTTDSLYVQDDRALQNAL